MAGECAVKGDIHSPEPGTRRIWTYHDVQCQIPNPRPGPHLDGYPECGLIDLHTGGHDYVRHAAEGFLRPREPEPEAGGRAVTPAEAIEAAELTEAETRYRNQVGRLMYEAGRRDAEAEMAARWARVAAAVRGPDLAEIEERRWGPGGRAHFADPRPGDFPGRAERRPS